MRIGAENFAAIQTLTTAAGADARPAPHCAARRGERRSATGACSGASASRATGRSSWSRPASPQGLGLLRSLAQALRLWSWGGVACDLVVVNDEPASYLMPLSRADRARCARRTSPRCDAQPGSRRDRLLTCCQSSDLHADELATLRALARVRLNADGRPLAHHVQELVELHERALEDRQAIVGRRAAGATWAAGDRAARADRATSRQPAASSASTSARCRGRRGRGSTCSPTRASARRSARPAAATAGR